MTDPALYPGHFLPISRLFLKNKKTTQPRVRDVFLASYFFKKRLNTEVVVWNKQQPYKASRRETQE